MNCPACSSPMTESQRGLLLIDQCTSCRALWFDRNELERYARTRRVYDDPPRVTIRHHDVGGGEGLPCPRCTPQMLEHGTWRAVPMALCPRCQGVFLTPEALRGVRATFGRRPRPDFHVPGTDDGTWDLIDYLLEPGKWQ